MLSLKLSRARSPFTKYKDINRRKTPVNPLLISLDLSLKTLRAKANYLLCLMPFSPIPQTKSDCPAGRKVFRRGNIFLSPLKQRSPSHSHIVFLFSSQLLPPPDILSYSLLAVSSPEQAPSLSCPSLHLPCLELHLSILVNENQNTTHRRPSLIHVQGRDVRTQNHLPIRLTVKCYDELPHFPTEQLPCTHCNTNISPCS